MNLAKFEVLWLEVNVFPLAFCSVGRFCLQGREERAQSPFSMALFANKDVGCYICTKERSVYNELFFMQELTLELSVRVSDVGSNV
jgi:hypothetical protein